MIDKIDLARHGVIEASAGTGKTYIIEQLVLRLLREGKAPLERILLVTYTDKAAGELRDRLRARLEEALGGERDDALRRRLQASLDDFEQATISTIHGFCQRILQEFPLEQGHDFHAELVDDPEMHRQALREVMRRHWRAWLGDAVAEAMVQAEFASGKSSTWENSVLALACNYRPQAGHVLRPSLLTDWPGPGLNPELWPEPLRPALRHQLKVRTIAEIHQVAQEAKGRRGLQSYEDMLLRVQASLDIGHNSSAEGFMAAVRQRYHYAIVDEFQDTDELQWRIFRGLFLEGGESRLFVVGDPKQAIYGFRGADVQAYVRAIKHLSNELRVQSYPLKVNWRSCQELVDGLNCLFDEGTWFGSNPAIGFARVECPPAQKQRARVLHDETGRAALTIVNWTTAESYKKARRWHAGFIAAEIDKLLDQATGPKLRIRINGKERDLNAGDIAILVQNRSEAEPVIDALRRRHISFTFWKWPGLWTSDEALHLKLLLNALAEPDFGRGLRQALLTHFFHVNAKALAQVEEIPADHPARSWFEKWRSWAAERDWAPLFQSLREKTGVFFSADHEDLDRRRANLRFLTAELEEAGYGDNLDLAGMLDCFRCREKQTEDAEAPIETDQPKVQLMTIHAAKGLERPVVFLAGGFTQKSYEDVISYHEGGQVVFDVAAEKEGKDRRKAERLDEQRRLFYVALTRAMFKLYVPLVNDEKITQPWAGPVATILSPALEQARPQKLGPKIAAVLQAKGFDRPGLPKASKGEVVKSEPSVQIDGDITFLLPTDRSIPRRRRVVESFSSLHRIQVHEREESFGEAPAWTPDEGPAEAGSEEPWRGFVFGDMVHYVLEHVDFNQVGAAASPEELLREECPVHDMLERQVRHNLAKLYTRTPRESLAEDGRRKLAACVWNALHTPLAEVGGPLWQISKEDRLPELNFLFAQADMSRVEEKFSTGFMDLVFRKGDRLFLLDWKTNLLPGYDRPELDQAMAEHDYHSQYRLYLQALNRWAERVRKIGKNIAIAGVYYLFVRGLNGRNESTGVFYHRAE